MDLTLEPLRVPESIHASDAGAFLDMVRIVNDSWRRFSGTDANDEEPAVLLSRWQDSSDQQQSGFLARAGDEVVGAATIGWDRSTSRGAELDVAPVAGFDHAGPLLLGALEDCARDHGRSVLQVWTGHRADAAGETLTPPTGFGRIPAGDANARLLLAHGYALEQVERNSLFDLTASFDRVDRQLAAALSAAGSDYRTVWWSGTTPPEHADGYARAIRRMYTDVPAGGMVTEQADWDADRLRRRDARHDACGELLGVTIVVHEPTGEVAAFNELIIGPDRTRPTQQYGTLVIPEHRGRRLGTIVKCVGLQRWRELVPVSPSVTTFNAEENRYMLDVNEAVGFVPLSRCAAWEKILS